MDDFVEFDAAWGSAGVATRPDDRMARVLVGKKGSGKTVYLRRFQASAAEEESLYADVIHQDPPQTSHVIQMGDWYPAPLLTEKWMAVWKAAILAAVTTHYLFADELQQYLDDTSRGRLARYSRMLFPDVESPRSAYDFVTALIARHERGHQLDRHLAVGAWRDLQYELGRVLRDAPPVCFYIDAVDEEFAAAPSHWLRCQKGLFYQVMRFLRDARLGGRLHLVICIRDVVFSSVLRSEHATRYRLDPHIRVLTWDEATIGFFIQQKLDRLPARFFRGDLPRRRTIESWLGLSSILNSRRAYDETVGDYLLRHTRLIPRDIVELGNLLCRMIDRRSGGTLTSTDVEGAVRIAASWFGSEQLQICSNQIRADQLPAHAADHKYVETYTAGAEWSRGIRQQIEDLIVKVGRDQFGLEELNRLRLAGEKAFGPQTDVLSVLWQNGLIGYRDDRRPDDGWVFYGVDDVDAFHLPVNKSEYAFHPCVIDATGISGGGHGTAPVHPYGRRNP